MPKKTRGGTKKSKNQLTRGRPKAKQAAEGDTSADDTTTSCYSEPLTSPESKAADEAEVESSAPPSPPAAPIVTSARTDYSNKENKQEAGEEEWEKLDLISELKASHGGKINYITNDLAHREFELTARQELLQLHLDLEVLKSTFESASKVTKQRWPEAKYQKLSDCAKTLNSQATFKELIAKLLGLPQPHGLMTYQNINIPEPLFEESEEEFEDQSQFNEKNQRFPSPAKMARYMTPTKQQGASSVFHFGTHRFLSTNKSARVAKPGEIFYSEGGSPILPRRIPDDYSARPFERVAITEPDGSKYEVDVIYRGSLDGNRIKEFKEFANDIRGIAASRTTVKQNRVQPPRILKAASSSKKAKGKPDWR